MKAEPEFLSTKQAAEWVGRSARWLYDIRKKPGEGPPCIRIGGHYFYRPQEILAWLRSRRVG